MIFLIAAEPPQDPATATIQPNNNTVIEISTQNQTLGILVLGGSDTLINVSINLLDFNRLYVY